MRVEFNPNKLTHKEMLWLKQNIIDYMEDDGFTRRYADIRHLVEVTKLNSQLN